MKTKKTNIKAINADIKVVDTNMSAPDIDNLLRLFMEGQTTEQQERILQHYFRTHSYIPAEWEPYKVLFDSFDTNLYDYNFETADKIPDTWDVAANSREPQVAGQQNTTIIPPP